MRHLILTAALLAAAAGANAQQASGSDLYKSSCAMCHQDQGQGAAGVAPPLKGSHWDKLSKVAGYAPGVLLAGMNGQITTDEGQFMGVMPTQNRLSDAEIAAVATYVLHDIAGQQGAPAVSAADVAALRARPLSVTELRALRKKALAK